MGYPIVNLKKGEGRTLQAGGMWVYDNEIDSILGDIDNGGLVIVRAYNGYPLGKGFINMNSKIRIRILTRDVDTEINDEFLEMRIRNAWDYRKSVTDISSCRIIFGEADFLPGLVIDKFSDVLVVQSLALGIDRYKIKIIDILKRILEEDGIHIKGVHERSDAKVRTQEDQELLHHIFLRLLLTLEAAQIHPHK